MGKTKLPAKVTTVQRGRQIVFAGGHRVVIIEGKAKVRIESPDWVRIDKTTEDGEDTQDN